MMNRYYIVNTNDPNLNAIFDIAVQDANTARYSVDGTKVIIKLPLGDQTQYDFLSQYAEADLSILQTAEWSNNNLPI